MIKRLRFAFQYALRNILRDRQRTIFALFSIAAGVATVVALRMLGLMLTDAFTANVRAYLRGDLVVQGRSRGPSVSMLDGGRSSAPISASTATKITQWAKANNVEVNFARTTELMQAAVVRNESFGSPAFVVAFFIDPATYPFYDTVRAQEPNNALLAQLLTGPNQIVIERQLANKLGIKVGDSMRVGTNPNLQTVKGIMPVGVESRPTPDSMMTFVFSPVYLSRAYSKDFGLADGAADKVFVKLPADQDPRAVGRRIRAEWPRSDTGESWRVNTITDAVEQNTIIANLLSRFVLLTSLVALVIGGVGIVNTMLVSVNRRSLEIAILKTVGLSETNVGLLFFAEAVLLGLMGSVVGLGLGLLLSLLTRSFGEQAFGVSLAWNLSADPLLLGLGMGLIITLLFSVFPVLSSVQVRPSIVLRSGSIPMARSGCIMSVFSLLLLLAGLSAISEAIIGDTSRFMPSRFQLPYGVIGTLVTFVLVMIILGLIWCVVWLLGKLPNFRNPNLRLAIRALSLHRGRTALSLFALIIGMTALSGTLIVGRSIAMLLSVSISQPLGGNVVLLPLIPGTDILAKGQLNRAPGVQGYREIRIVDADLRAINGDRSYRDKITIPDDLQSAFNAAKLEVLVGMNVTGNPPRGKLLTGRFLNAEDAGKDRIVIPYLAELDALGVKVGSTFTYSINRKEREFEVVGIVSADDALGLSPISFADGSVVAPLQSVPRVAPFDFMVASVEPAKLNDVLGALGAPGTFILDVSIFDTIINQLFGKVAAMPVLVAILSLLAAAALIGTTVSLATLERRRQIAILKALGVKRGQVLGQLLVENAIIGTAGGVISLLPTFAIIQAVPAMTQNVVTLPLPVDLVVLMLATAIIITVAATLLTARPASGEKPLAALRYE